MPPRLPLQAKLLVQCQLLIALSIQLALLIPTIVRLIQHYYIKEPYHTSLLSGEAWYKSFYMDTQNESEPN